ncbi:MAG: Alpha-D-glucose 1-phosphate phosphatase YihX [Alphaproteobacteria bacterium]|nr:MAG: Alpha-D-glucose 1-phosphate phosphatase YihX [Alphaproteobacteria bacterium]
MAAYKAIIWDFGGVITASPFEAFNRYEAAQDLPNDFIRTINAQNPDTNAWARFERSDIDATEFDTAFRAEALAAGHDVPGSDVLALLAGDIRPEMVAVLDGLKARGYRLACITNNVKTGADETPNPGMAREPKKAAAIADVMARFEMVIESSIEGLRKPDPAIYQLACDKLGLQAHDCVFLDDLGINLKPARAMGMGTVKVLTAAQAIADLAALLGHELP